MRALSKGFVAVQQNCGGVVALVQQGQGMPLSFLFD
jgi:hypothetical protein